MLDTILLIIIIGIMCPVIITLNILLLVVVYVGISKLIRQAQDNGRNMR